MPFEKKINWAVLIIMASEVHAVPRPCYKITIFRECHGNPEPKRLKGFWTFNSFTKKKGQRKTEKLFKTCTWFYYSKTGGGGDTIYDSTAVKLLLIFFPGQNSNLLIWSSTNSSLPTNTQYTNIHFSIENSLRIINPSK